MTILIINSLTSSTSSSNKLKTTKLPSKLLFTLQLPKATPPFQPLFTMHFTLFALSAAIALPLASAYPVDADDLHCRSGPGTNYGIVKSYKRGTELTITCQAPGTDVNGDKLWDKTSDGCYVTDYYVKTGTSGYVTKHCDSGSTGGGSSGGHGANEATLELIGQLEGWSANYYYINGHKTIGYGHDCVEKGCSGINAPLTKQEGLNLLKKDIVGFEDCVCNLPNAKALNANEYGALVSFAYNSGCGGVSRYWRSAMEQKNFKGICEALPHTNTLGGELNNRRRQEGEFCSKPTSEKAGC